MLYWYMDGCFNAIRWFLTIIFAIVLTFIYLFLPLSLAVYINLGSPDKIIEWTSDTGVYGSLVDIGFKVAIEKTEDGALEEGTSLSEEELNEIANTIISEEWLEESGEEIIRGFYLWINGESPHPEFELDLAERKDEITNALEIHLNAKLNQLPKCTGVTSEDFNIFKSQCIPDGVNKTAEVSNVLEQMLDHEDFLADAKFTGEDLNIPQETLEQVPNAFSNFKMVIFLSIVLALLLPVLMIIMAPTWRKGVVVLATLGLLAGGANIIASIFFILSTSAMTELVIGRINLEDGQLEEVQSILLPLLNSAAYDISITMLITSSIIFSIGVVSSLSLIVLKKK